MNSQIKDITKQLENCNKEQLEKISDMLAEMNMNADTVSDTTETTETETTDEYRYAVVHWYNYRKELSAGFLQGFDDLEEVLLKKIWMRMKMKMLV